MIQCKIKNGKQGTIKMYRLHRAEGVINNVMVERWKGYGGQGVYKE
jgi:hypothetical protein